MIRRCTLPAVVATTLAPGRYSLQTEGASVTLSDTFEVTAGSQDGVHRDDPSQVIVVSDREEDLNALIDDVESWLPEADIQQHQVEVAGATSAMLAVNEATGTDAPLSQSALMVTSEAGYTFPFSYLSGIGTYDLGTADEVVATFELSIGE
jgi:hypothetical protein